MKKTVIVTGASSGLGFEIAKAYLARGFNVVINARSMDRLQTAAAHLGNPSNLLLVAGDIAAPATAKALFAKAEETFGKVDILVNNAGVFIAKAAVDYTEADTDLLVNTNLKGFLFPAQEAVRHMSSNGGGHIVNITASLGVAPPKATALVAILIKGGLNMATRALALEVADKNIKVNAVAPGIIQTPMHAKDLGTQDFLKGLQPNNTIGTPEDIANAVLYLTDSSFVSGHILTVDDGASAGNW